jgi:hypothetical protein
MAGQRPIDDFMSHIDAMRSLVGFLIVLPTTVPHVLALLTEEQRRAIYEPCVKTWIDFNRELYNDLSLYVDPPNPLPVDQNCPPLKLSDEIKARRGRNHPFFDFIHAPLTHPLGTQISLICINYCWDAYDTFVKRTISTVTEESSQHSNCLAFVARRTEAKKQGLLLSTQEQLELLQLSIDDSDLEEFLKVAEPKWSPLKARELLTIAKALRSIFTHHFGKPDEKLRLLVEQQKCEAIKIIDDNFEVQLPIVRDVSTVVQGHALIIHRKKVAVYGGDMDTA